jgi:sarcosine oxidase
MAASSSVYDVVVCGLGAHGASTLRALSKRGNLKVLGLEQASANSQTHGSSHGRSRIIRTGYFEDPAYVPLLLESFSLWSELEEETANHYEGDKDQREKILELTGGLMIGDPRSEIIEGTLTTVKQHNLPHLILSPQQVKEKYRVFNLKDNEVAIYEAQAGYVVPEAGRDAFIQSALRHNKGETVVQYDSEVVSIESAIGEDGATLLSQDADQTPLKRITIRTTDNNNVDIEADSGEHVVYAKQIALALGPWTAKFVSSSNFRLRCSISLPSLKLQRRVLFWIHPKAKEMGEADNEIGEEADLSQLPIYIWDTPSDGAFYGFPSQSPSEGLKVALHSFGDPHNIPPCGDGVVDNDPKNIYRDIDNAEVENVLRVLKDRVPCLGEGVYRDGATCYYTTTKDEHFILDFLPLESHGKALSSDGKGEVLLVSCCSGHGYKFSTVLGEIAADLLIEGSSERETDLFKIDRPGLR